MSGVAAEGRLYGGWHRRLFSRALHLLIAVVAVSAQSAWAAPGYRNITPDFTILRAPQDLYQPEDFFSPEAPGGFQPLNPPANVARLGNDAWLRTTLPAYSPEAPADILEIPGQIFNFIDVWFRLPDGSVAHYHAGDRYPYVERSVKHANIAFPIPRVDGPLDVLIRARNITSHAMNFTAWTWPRAEWDNYVMTKRLWYGVFFGAILALCLYNLFLAATLRDVSYFYYIGYVLCLSASVFVLGGLADEFLWPRGKPAPVVLALSGTGAFLGIGFANNFLRIRHTAPWIYRVTTAIGALAMVSGVLLIFLPKLPLVPAEYSARVVHGLLLCAALYFIAVSFGSYLRGVTHARFLALSMLCLLGCMAVYFSYTYGFVLYNRFIGHSLEFGALAEGILLSLALADRINLLTRQKEAAEQQALVYHRTFSRNLIRAQERERQAVAEALHDTIGHGLLVLRNNLRGLAGAPVAAAAGQAAETQRSLLAQADYCGEILHEVRGMSHELHPHMLKRLGLATAVEAMFGRALDSVGVDWSVEIDEQCSALDPDLQAIAYRTVQECLNNVMKHAGASHVSCELVRDGDTVKGCVYDDGTGFDVAATGGRTVGLEEMAGRLNVIGGTLDIESSPGQGTVVSFTIPLTLAGEQADIPA